jgi:hypothetical protein
MMKEADSLALAARIEREGLTPELCEAAALAFGWQRREHTTPGYFFHDTFRGRIVRTYQSPNLVAVTWVRGECICRDGLPPYATSLDAVRAEMPEGRDVREIHRWVGRWRVIMSGADPWHSETATAPTMEAAWLAAILRAVVAENNQAQTGATEDNADG